MAGMIRKRAGRDRPVLALSRILFRSHRQMAIGGNGRDDPETGWSRPARTARRRKGTVPAPACIPPGSAEPQLGVFRCQGQGRAESRRAGARCSQVWPEKGTVPVPVRRLSSSGMHAAAWRSARPRAGSVLPHDPVGTLARPLAAAARRLSSSRRSAGPKSPAPGCACRRTLRAVGDRRSGPVAPGGRCPPRETRPWPRRPPSRTPPARSCC